MQCHRYSYTFVVSGSSGACEPRLKCYLIRLGTAMIFSIQCKHSNHKLWDNFHSSLRVHVQWSTMLKHDFILVAIRKSLTLPLLTFPICSTQAMLLQLIYRTVLIQAGSSRARYFSMSSIKFSAFKTSLSSAFTPTILLGPRPAIFPAAAELLSYAPFVRMFLTRFIAFIFGDIFFCEFPYHSLEHTTLSFWLDIWFERNILFFQMSLYGQW